MKFRHGDRVVCEIQGKAVTDAKISIANGSHYICQNVVEGAHSSDRLGYKYSWIFNPSMPEGCDVTNLRPTCRTIDSHPLEEGDVVIDEKGKERIILGVCGKVVFVSGAEDKEWPANYIAQKDLCESGWTLKQLAPTEPEVTEVTLEAVAKAMGIPVEKLRIKD